jgi:hypothetical protein
MKNQVVRTCLLAVVGFSLTVLPLKAATYIYGDIAFTGGATLNGSLATATAFTSIFGPLGPGNDVQVLFGATGDYAGVPGGTLATFNAFAFNPAPVTPFTLWTFTVGPTTYRFDIDSVVISFQGAFQGIGFLNLQGEGTAHITGFDPTPGTWSITDTGANGPVFSFGNVTSVPEPSTSLFILGGFGLMLITTLRRRKH